MSWGWRGRRPGLHGGRMLLGERSWNFWKVWKEKHGVVWALETLIRRLWILSFRDCATCDRRRLHASRFCPETF